MIWVQRAYDPVRPERGRRWLVDRIWPRGVSKGAAALEGWIREVAPSDALRRWFAHDPSRFAEFRRRYREELQVHPEAVDRLMNMARAGDITLVYAAHDEEHNNAVVLCEYLKDRLDG